MATADKEQLITIPMVDADEAHTLVSSGYGYLDVRMSEDFDKGHATGAQNIPYYVYVAPQGREKNPHFEEEVAALYGKESHLIVGCFTGTRSKLASSDLLNAGFKNVRNLQGGYRSFLQSATQQPTNDEQPSVN
ncbi:thiosulfate sulfurtransferase 16, chloroplastic-like isoform X1 [Lolium rigidum]|uniref:thiosulfate sulfurtransferase 16, chloroplastic-like isoform X1 n=1 Tax=Lolium rigidum TaxID=89674 RepID=UPI001F5C3BB2|nr:thiosulfate sulfurtransferase 16, chloroplastic-like isoform X1 [Lolium rigidum]